VLKTAVAAPEPNNAATLGCCPVHPVRRGLQAESCLVAFPAWESAHG
jgi:hypothetical protein